MHLAHRGLHGSEHPENSIGALVAAARHGLDGIEFDVRFSSDGVAFLAHDRTLLRTHDDPRAVDLLSSRELASLGVPRLDEALDALPGGLYVDLELKALPASSAGPDTMVSLAAQLHRVADRLVVSSFDAAHLRHVAAHVPGVARWLNVEPGTNLSGAISAASDLACSGVSLGLPDPDRRGSLLVHAAGLELALWTLRDRAEREVLETPGLVAVCVEGAAATR